MHVIVERRYIFRRKTHRARVVLAVLASAVALTGVSATIDDAKPGGFHRAGAIEGLAKSKNTLAGTHSGR